VKIHSSVGKIVQIEFESELEFNANNDLCSWVICEHLTLKNDDVYFPEKLFSCINSNGKRLYLPCSYIENKYSIPFICNTKWRKTNGGWFLKNEERNLDYDGVFFMGNSQYSLYNLNCGRGGTYCLTEERLDDDVFEFTYQNCYE
jgi:hypothetical protein